MSFQPPSRSLTARDQLFIALVVILFLVISAGLFYANLSLPRGGGEFLRHWAGSRAFVFERIDPYSAYVPDAVQKLVYDRAAGVGDEPYILDTPFHLLLLYLPFTLLSDPMIARAVYALLLEWALFALAILSLRLTDWTAPRWFTVLFFLSTVLNYYSFQAILDASPVLLLGLFYAGILLALRNGQDELAGAMMAVSLYYWEAGLPFLILMAWQVHRQGRVRVMAGFGMLSFILLVVSFLIYPNWLIPYLRAGANNLRAVYGYSLVSVLQGLLPAYGKYLAWAVVALLVIALGYEWNTLHQADERRLYWVACLCLAASPWLGFRTELENLSVLVIPLAFVFSVVYDRWRRAGAVVAFLLLLLVLLMPWALYLFALPILKSNFGDILYLFLPVFTLLGLYWIRWWAIRPPRIWADSLMYKK